ncbi:uncharacterized protein LOC131246848 isoform X2 [Magnolia sinica]|uniref:uncharacterized protein LOC131246848 isoform X2 n=1 Tax=Magnolia sinica TaxID=86752 RepID=UPI00265800C8|nr:uncharacterized protein LOC131246848 isoform X2 [Magnolia sinica]
MIQLLFLVLFAEGVVALLLMVKIGPLRELMVRGLDQLKIGKGPATVKTLACTMSLIFASSVTSILKIQNRGVKLGTLTPMDQVLWRTHLLEASLIGLRMSVRASKQEIEKLRKEHLHLKEKEERASNDAKLLQEEVSSIKEKLQKLKVEAEEKEKQVASAEAHVVALQKQSEDLLLEYDRLLEDNQILQSQALGFQDLR